MPPLLNFFKNYVYLCVCCRLTYVRAVPTEAKRGHVDSLNIKVFNLAKILETVPCDPQEVRKRSAEEGEGKSSSTGSKEGG